MKLKNFLLSTIKPYKWLIFGLLLVALIWGVNNSLTPYVLKLIIDKAVAFEGDKLAAYDAFIPLVGLYVFLWVILALDMRVLDWIRLTLFPKVRFDIVKNMFSYLNRHSYNYFQNNFAGSLSNKISDMTSGTSTILGLLDDVIAQCIGLIVAIIAMFLINPIFGIIFVIWVICFSAITVYFSKKIVHLSDFFAVAKTTLMGKIVDSISNIMSMRLFARNSYEDTLIHKATQDTVNKDRDMQWYILKMRMCLDTSIILLIGFNLYALVRMYSIDLVSVGDFAFIITLSISMIWNLWFLANQYVSFSEEWGKCTQALTILTATHEIKDNENAFPLKITQGKIEFNNVNFHYDQGKHLFKNKTVIIKPGEKVGLVGFSGSGKSTFVNLILRLFDVESGQIRIDNQNIAEVAQDSLREQIAFIPQDISLFHRTLMENIRYGNLHASDDEVIEASKKAHCHEFISQLGQGYQALVGERGIKLSGGQRQRIAIARAMLKNTPILILDEATSSLDSVTEKLIQESLHLLMSGRTTIVIAHRLSTLTEMDRILVFDNGRIIEDGSHDDLIMRNGRYAKMWKMQTDGFLPEKE